MDEYEDAARRVVGLLSPPAARNLLTLLEFDGRSRVEMLRQLNERGGRHALLDYLNGLEADPVMRGWLVEYLRLRLDT
jgi:hypothetical protein